ncbi:SRPBCC family protein [Candidatus Cyanaurora vandensis]|uniref:SRPBCC family protein n=1 Tax=Candidatus Cyanaurora vandensis TaxID=2714958 RepID=UPI00257FE5AA|nr:SRPBCC family protein [Candidatus Cyanaurora vandensis]
MAIGTNDTTAAHGNHRVSIEVQAPQELVYRLWSQFERFPDYFRHVREVTVDPQDSSIQHWKGAVLGLDQEWDAQVTALTPYQVIAWRSISGFENSGSLTFEERQATNGTGSVTYVTVQIGYDPPLGVLGDFAEAVWVKQRFDNGLEQDLSQFKELAERLYQQVGTGRSMDQVLNEAGITSNPNDGREKAITTDYTTSHVPMPNIITTQEFKNRLDWGEVGFTILDVRPVELFKLGHIRGASSTPLEVLVEQVYAIAGKMEGGLDRQILVYGDQDGLSQRAAQILRAEGYTIVLDYVDGFSAWQAAGLPVETQSIGQIDAKGLPERSDYLDRVITAPTIHDNPTVGPEPSTRKDGPAGVAAVEGRDG